MIYQTLDPPKLLPMTPQFTVVEQTKYIAQCNVNKGSEPLFYQWTKDGKAINDQTIKMVTTESIGSSLIIDKVTMNNDGNYTCIVRNAFGEDSQSTRLSVKGLFDHLLETY